jgi:hypothetical protein
MADAIESRMNFIIEQQAQFAADIQILKERQGDALRLIEGNSRQIESTRAMVHQLVDVCLSLARHGEETDRRIKEIGEETDRRIKELVEAGAHTDRRLDALIDTVDKLVRHNGS